MAFVFVCIRWIEAFTVRAHASPLSRACASGAVSGAESVYQGQRQGRYLDKESTVSVIADNIKGPSANVIVEFLGCDVALFQRVLQCFVHAPIGKGVHGFVARTCARTVFTFAMILP